MKARETASRENEDMEAMLPVEKNPDWMRKREKREVRASARVRGRYLFVLAGEGVVVPLALGFTEVVPFEVADGVGLEWTWTACSSSTQVARVMQKAR